MNNRTTPVKVGFLLSLLSLLAVACEEEREKMRYDKGIAKIYSSGEDVPDSLIGHAIELPNELNLRRLKDNKIAVAKIPSVWQEKSDNYIYGQSKIFNDTVIIYSNEYDAFEAFNNPDYHKITGFLLLIREGKIYQWLRIYDSATFSVEYLTSFLFDNYLITVFIYDPRYDIIVEGEEDMAEYSFVVTEITSEGTMRFLEEMAGREVAGKYMSNNEWYRGRF